MWVAKKSFFVLNWSLVVLLSLFMIIYYADNRRPDIYHYIDNAELLIQGKNPYTEGTARWGTFGPLVLVPVSRILSEYQISVFTIVASIFSLYLFAKFALRISKYNLPIFLNIALILSSTRELFALGQINAICLGMLSAAVALDRTSSRSTILLWAKRLLIAYLGAASIDMKPHVVLLPTLVLYLQFLSKRHLFETFALLTGSHIAIDLIGMRFYELDWIRSLFIQSHEFTRSESKNLLGLIDEISSMSTNLLTIMSLTIFILVNLVAFKHFNNEEFHKALMLVALSGFFLPYFHFYDFLIPVMIFINYVLLERHTIDIFSWMFAFILLIPQEIGKISSFLVTLLLVGFVQLTKRQFKERNVINVGLPIIGGFFLSTCVLLLLGEITQTNFEYQSIVNSISICAFVLSIGLAKRVRD